MALKKQCPKGHIFYKSSDCLSCPVCESENKPTTGFLSLLSAPARRALENAGITNLEALSTYSEKELLRLHGLGKSTLPVLKKALSEKNLCLKL